MKKTSFIWTSQEP